MAGAPSWLQYLGNRLTRGGATRSAAGQRHPPGAKYGQHGVSLLPRSHRHRPDAPALRRGVHPTPALLGRRAGQRDLVRRGTRHPVSRHSTREGLRPPRGRPPSRCSRRSSHRHRRLPREPSALAADRPHRRLPPDGGGSRAGHGRSPLDHHPACERALAPRDRSPRCGSHRDRGGWTRSVFGSARGARPSTASATRRRRMGPRVRTGRSHQTSGSLGSDLGRLLGTYGPRVWNPACRRHR